MHPWRGTAPEEPIRAVTRLTKSDIRRLLELLDAELEVENAVGELYLVG